EHGEFSQSIQGTKFNQKNVNQIVATGDFGAILSHVLGRLGHVATTRSRGGSGKSSDTSGHGRDQPGHHWAVSRAQSLAPRVALGRGTGVVVPLRRRRRGQRCAGRGCARQLLTRPPEAGGAGPLVLRRSPPRQAWPIAPPGAGIPSVAAPARDRW